jgi:hypothetical protein
LSSNRIRIGILGRLFPFCGASGEYGDDQGRDKKLSRSFKSLVYAHCWCPLREPRSETPVRVVGENPRYASGTTRLKRFRTSDKEKHAKDMP